MNPLQIVFFGSFQTYSVQVLKALAGAFSIPAVITTPPKPAGRHMELTQTPVYAYAQEHNLPIFPLVSLKEIPKDIKKPDFVVVAGYGKLIPEKWLHFPTIMSVNMHPSLLPQYRGAFPAEWAILRGEKKTGVSLVKMSPEFDKGEILVQESLPIAPSDTRETLYKKLYDMGGKLLVSNLPLMREGMIKPRAQPPSGDSFYARRLTREDGFVPWQEALKHLKEEPQTLDLKLRALAPWPGVWTTTPQGERLKILSVTPQKIVQLEGKKPVPFAQFATAYLSSPLTDF